MGKKKPSKERGERRRRRKENMESVVIPSRDERERERGGDAKKMI